MQTLAIKGLEEEDLHWVLLSKVKTLLMCQQLEVLKGEKEQHRQEEQMKYRLEETLKTHLEVKVLCNQIMQDHTQLQLLVITIIKRRESEVGEVLEIHYLKKNSLYHQSLKKY